jgi:hypothetical protein
LDIVLEISQTEESIAGSVEVVGPTVGFRRMEATLRLREGEIAVLGGIEERSVAYAKRGVPYLMNIPLLGLLFSRIDQRETDTELIAVVEARVLRTFEEDMAETIRRRLAFERSISRVSDLKGLKDNPYAVLIETLRSKVKADQIAESFSSDGYETRVTEWTLYGEDLYDVYLTELTSFTEAGALARRLSDAGWETEITVLSPINELAGD